MRAGLVLIVLGGVAHLSRLRHGPVAGLQPLAQESLMIYAVHIAIVYGSVWSPGLRQIIGPTLPLGPALVWVVALWAAMIGLATAWRWCKRQQPRSAWWVRVGVGGALLGRLV